METSGILNNKKNVTILCFLISFFSNVSLLHFTKRLAHNRFGAKSLPSLLTTNNLRSTGVVQ